MRSRRKLRPPSASWRLHRWRVWIVLRPPPILRRPPMLLNHHQFTTILVRFRNTEFDHVIGSGEHQVETLHFFPLLKGMIPWFECLQMIRWVTRSRVAFQDGNHVIERTRPPKHSWITQPVFPRSAAFTRINALQANKTPITIFISDDNGTKSKGIKVRIADERAR